MYILRYTLTVARCGSLSFSLATLTRIKHFVVTCGHNSETRSVFGSVVLAALLAGLLAVLVAVVFYRLHAETAGQTVEAKHRDEGRRRRIRQYQQRSCDWHARRSEHNAVSSSSACVT